VTAEPWAAGPQCFSDRGPAAPETGVGFDTVRLRGPARPKLLYYLDERQVRRLPSEGTTYTRAGWSRFRVGQTHVRVSCNSRTGPLEVAMEFSGPMVRHGSNVRGLSLHELSDVITLVVETLAEDLPGLLRPEAMRIIRLDLVRDFTDIGDASAILTALAHLPSTGRYRQETHSRPDASTQIQTLTRGVPKRWRVNGYDKAHEQDELAVRRREARGQHSRTDEPSQLRWEVQLLHRTMRTLRAEHGSLLEGSSKLLTDIAAEYFVRSEFNRYFNGGATVLIELMRELAETREGKRHAQTIAAYYVGEMSGVEMQSHNTVDAARKLLRDRGLTIADLTSPPGVPTRLDFSTGQLEESS
jgi:hypothetical protein